jgi:hypothetical protein
MQMAGPDPDNHNVIMKMLGKQQKFGGRGGE